MTQATADSPSSRTRPAAGVNVGHVLFLVAIVWLAAFALPPKVEMPAGCEVTVMGDVGACFDN